MNPRKMHTAIYSQIVTFVLNTSTDFFSSSFILICLDEIWYKQEKKWIGHHFSCKNTSSQKFKPKHTYPYSDIYFKLEPDLIMLCAYLPIKTSTNCYMRRSVSLCIESKAIEDVISTDFSTGYPIECHLPTKSAVIMLVGWNFKVINNYVKRIMTFGPGNTNIIHI